MATLKVKILKSTVADKKNVFEGKVYDISEEDAKLLIKLGKAELATGKEKAVEKEEAEIEEELADPDLGKGKKGKKGKE